MTEYSKEAVDKCIASSNRRGPEISKKEAKLIHGLLKGWRDNKEKKVETGK